VDICGGVYFHHLIFIIKFYPTFIVLSQTEVGSAGEQPARDSLMLEVNILNSRFYFNGGYLF
jgi:hypothetical protein